MSLHDVQVILSAANIADRIQQVNQHQGQVAQSQNAMRLENQAQLSLTQTQQTGHETDSKSIEEKEKRGRNLKKNAKDMETAVVNPPLGNEISKPTDTPTGNIIDIKV